MNDIASLAKLIRYWSLLSTTKAGSGHPTSSLSAADLMSVLFFGGFFHFDLTQPQNIFNDRLIFSKGHASPLFYALWAAAGAFPAEELVTLRKFGSRLEGHPTLAFPFTEVPTGSLGQGLSAGLGMALSARLHKANTKTFVLLGDSEMAEGSIWEALQLAAHYKVNNLIGILDVNRLGQRGETMYGHDVHAYENRVGAFGWQTIVIDGHSIEEITKAYTQALAAQQPVMIIAKTIKGKGVSFLEDKESWHGKALSEEDFQKAAQEFGQIDTALRGEVAKPEQTQLPTFSHTTPTSFSYDKPTSTRKAYGNALVRLAAAYPELIALDAETSNSTFAEDLKKAQPEKFLEMYIAEQNMVGTATGLARRGYMPCVSTFTAFFTRAFDQIRMAGYAQVNVKFVGSHAGVSIGEDGSSQMGLEDLAMFRSVIGSTVLYPSDAVAAEKIMERIAEHQGLTYMRTTRKDTPILYDANEAFPIGGSKTLRHSDSDKVTVVAAGITLHEALRAYDLLHQQNINIRVIDLYSIKPIDAETLQQAIAETKTLIVVEDHYPEGGMAEAVRSVVDGRVISLAVRKMPRSGTPAELLAYEDISAEKIVKTVLKP